MGEVVRSPFQIGPFRRLVATTVLNETSSAMAVVVLPLVVLGGTGSASLAGGAVAVSTASLITCQVFGGALVDRHSPSVALRASSWIQAFGWTVVLLAVVLPATGVSYLLVLTGALIAGAASGLDGPSEHSLLKVLVPQPLLGRATAVSQGREATAGLVGGPLGGALFAVAAPLALAVQIVLHTLAGVLTPRATSTARAAGQSFREDLVEGYRLVVRHRGLVATAVVAGVANVPIVASPLTLLASYQQSGVSPVLIGVMSSAFGAGVLIGAFIAGPVSSRLRLGSLGVIAISVFATGMVACIFTYRNFWLTCAVLALSAVPLPAFNAAIGAYTAAITPEGLMGRVTAATGYPECC